MDAEIQLHAKNFHASLAKKISDNVEAIAARQDAKLHNCYARLTTLQAWRSYVLDEHVSSDAMGFFSEAQNDGLTSSVLVASGLWRPAMKSLRSMIENILQCFYYMDHPVEYKQWEAGEFRPTFKYLFDYFTGHPDIKKLPASLQSTKELKSHYSYLSNVVHSSAKEFRMTNDIDRSALWKTTDDGIGKWHNTQKNVLRDINLLMLSLFAEHLKGARNKGLREALGITVPAARDAAIKASLAVKITRA